MIDSVIFDLDGTLWDASEQICEHWHKIFPYQTLNEIQKILGKTTSEIANYVGASEKLITKIQQAENSYLKTNPGKIYVGVKEALDDLYYNKYKLFIASNCQSGYIETFLNAYRLSKYFEESICFGDTNKSKTDNVKFLIEKYKLNSIMVGDTDNDKTAAVQNNIPFVWASYGFGQVDWPDTIENMPQLLKYLRR